jgi:hypothetical protein
MCAHRFDELRMDEDSLHPLSNTFPIRDPAKTIAPVTPE